MQGTVAGTLTGVTPLSADDARVHLELQRLAYLYCHAVDRCDLVLLRSLYHDDAIDDHGEMFCGSPDEYVAWLPRMLAGLEAIRHTISNMVFHLDGETAQGELCSTAYHRVGGREIVIEGRYLDTYERRDGVWRILRRSLVMDAFSDRPVSEATGFGGIPRGVVGAGDPVYALSLFAAARRS